MSAVRIIELPQERLDSQRRRGIDLWVFLAVLSLVALGIVMVFSASIPMAAVDETEDIYYFLKKQFLFAGIGMIALLAASRVSMAAAERHALKLLILATTLLVLVLIFGDRINGAKSWLPIPGTGLRFQPSEVAKIALIIAAAGQFAKCPGGIHTWRGALPPLAMLGVTAVLIAVEPDLGTAAVLVMAMLAYFHIAGARFRHLLAAGGLGIALAGIMIWQHPYQLERLRGFLLRQELMSEGGFQTTHSLIAMGSGGWLGRGICGSVEKYFYLPAAINDSILAVIGEEVGLVVTLAVLAAFALLLWRGMRIGARAPDRFSALVAIGVTCLFAVQAMVNIAVATAVVPCTGVPLPFVSYGGSSLVFSLIGAGLLLNVSRTTAGKPYPREAT
jgi:cell division protein FtsW